MKRKVASATKKRSTSTRPVSRRASRAAPPPSDDSEDMWLSPGEPYTEPQSPAFSPRHPPGPRIDTTKTWSPVSLFLFYCKLLFSIKPLCLEIIQYNSACFLFIIFILCTAQWYILMIHRVNVMAKGYVICRRSPTMEISTFI
ncbi:hypothetical protein CHARACLAT_014262 [Characodon lateralis]|uniref:Uncharacterized protein n=1 Tax=Characodon lateralis TaxID=208331 RepID=A0ABU7E0G2_9TELE|nr:hypothetical protein [Characodon lateralis]